MPRSTGSTGSASAEPLRRAEAAGGEGRAGSVPAADLERSERQFADAQALAHVGSWERDMTEPRSVWSDELCRIFGQPLGFSPRYPEFSALIHPEDRDRVAASLARARAGELVDAAYRIVRPDGEVRYVHGRAYGRTEAGREAPYVYGTVQDVTERRIAEMAGREAQDLFETAFAQAPIGMALIGLDGHWLKVNAALCRITGWSEGELLQRPFQEITHPDDVGSDVEQIRMLLAGESSGYQFEKRYLTRSGAEIWALLSVSLVRDSSGAPRHFIVQIEDISAAQAGPASAPAGRGRRRGPSVITPPPSSARWGRATP